MAVVIETTLGDLTVDLFLEQRPRACLNFIKLCKMKYYNFNLFHSIQSGFLAQTGDPTGSGKGGESIWGLLEGEKKRYFFAERVPRIRHSDVGMLSMVCTGEDSLIGSQFFFTLGPDLDSLDATHCVIGVVTEGHDILRQLNEVICDETNRPYRDVRITHTVILEDPFNDPKGLRAPSRSPSPSAERLIGGRIAPDEDIDETKGKTVEEINELIEAKEAKARATILEIVGDLPDADVAPPENVLFVCKLNPVTTDSDLEIIFSRFGKIVNCEIIRDKKTGDSLQYAFIEFEDQKSCENAYFKMDNVLIDDRRIHVDFSQSVSKVKYLGKGRGVRHMNEKDRNEKIENIISLRRRSRSRDRQPYSRNQDVSKSRDRPQTDRDKERRKSRERSKRTPDRNQHSRDRDRYRETTRSDRDREISKREHEQSSSQYKARREKEEADRKKERDNKPTHRRDERDKRRSRSRSPRNSANASSSRLSDDHHRKAYERNVDRNIEETSHKINEKEKYSYHQNSLDSKQKHHKLDSLSDTKEDGKRMEHNAIVANVSVQHSARLHEQNLLEQKTSKCHTEQSERKRRHSSRSEQDDISETSPKKLSESKSNHHKESSHIHQNYDHSKSSKNKYKDEIKTKSKDKDDSSNNPSNEIIKKVSSDKKSVEKKSKDSQKDKKDKGTKKKNDEYFTKMEAKLEKIKKKLEKHRKRSSSSSSSTSSSSSSSSSSDSDHKKKRSSKKKKYSSSSSSSSSSSDSDSSSSSASSSSSDGKVKKRKKVVNKTKGSKGVKPKKKSL